MADSIQPNGGALAGRTIAIPETRELERLSALLADRGAKTLAYPMIDIRDVTDPAPVTEWLRRLAGGDFQDLILMTGEGVTRLCGFAARAGIHGEVVAALSRVRTITRGPKPARALHQLGISPTLPAVVATTDGIIETLAHEPLHGRAVGLQLYGQVPNPRLVDFLERAGAAVFSVAPYVYLPASDDTKVADLIRRLAEGSIDLIAFTTRVQIDRLFEVAASQALMEELRHGLRRTRIAAVGPVVVATLRERGLRIDAVPEKSFFLRPLVDQVVELLLGADLALGI